MCSNVDLISRCLEFLQKLRSIAMERLRLDLTENTIFFYAEK